MARSDILLSLVRAGATRVASTGSNLWVVIWSAGDSIEACRVADLGTTVSDRYQVAQDSNCLAPDIGHADLASFDSFLIVWQHENNWGTYEIRGRRYLAYDGPDGGWFTIANSVANNRTNPSVNQSGDNYFVAWEEHLNAERVDIDGRYVGFDDTPGMEFDLFENQGLAGHPSVASDPVTGLFLITWHSPFADSVNNYNIHFTSATSTTQGLPYVLTWDSALEYRPCAVYSGTNAAFVIAYGKADSWDAQWDVHARAVYPNLGTAAPEETIASESYYGEHEVLNTARR